MHASIILSSLAALSAVMLYFHRTLRLFVLKTSDASLAFAPKGRPRFDRKIERIEYRAAFFASAAVGVCVQMLFETPPFV
jgi:hypothetical protein